MQNLRVSSKKQTLLTGMACLAFMASLPVSAVAQSSNSEDNASDEIVVTGSRIARTSFESLQPATVLNQEALELRASINIADTLNEQAGFGLPGNSTVGAQGGASVGQNFANFLGLGSQRTLTLVNTQRFPSGAAPNGGGGLSVDLNAIPAALIDRVETIAIGGAPAYGADAIAGTVNIILKDDFEGLDVVASAGISPEYGDAERLRAGVTWGSNFDNDRGNLVLAGEYSTAAGLFEVDRETTEDGLGFFGPADPNSPFSSVLINDPTVAVDNALGGPLLSGGQFRFNIFGNGIRLDPTDPNSPLAAFDENGNLVPFIPGGGTNSPIFQQGGDGLDLNELTALYTDLDRYNANVFVNYDLTDNMRFKGELWFAQTKATELVNQPDYNSPAFGGLPGNTYGDFGEGPVAILLDNPFLPDATRTTIGIATDFNNDGTPDNNVDTDNDGIPDAPGFYRFGGLFSLQGDNPSSSKRSTYRAVAGLEGDGRVGDKDIKWDLTYAYGRTESNDSSTEIVQDRFNQAVLVTTDAAGNAVCVDQSNGCAPINLLGTTSQASIDFATARVTDRVTVEQQYIQGNVTTELFEMPAGPVGVAAGFTYREESAKYDPNDLGANGFLRNPLVAIDGDFSSSEIYGETVIPLLGGNLDTPLVEVLEFEGAARLVDNSINGSDVTWTAGGRYQPISDVEFRGNYTKSIRSPSITELFTPTSRINTFASDPCDSRFIDQGNFPDRRAANCSSDGINQPFQSFIVNASQPGTLSGNQELQNESAKSWTIGAILRPSFLEGFTASIDWMDIDISNAIETLNATDILNACYDSADFAGEASCDLFTRDAGGQVTNVSTGFVNVGQLEFSGLISSISYGHGLGEYGDMNYTLNHIYTENLVETVGAGNPNRNDGEIGNSKHRVNATATWSKDKWRVYSQYRWLDSAVFDNADTETSRDVLGVDAWFNVDAGIGYEVNDQIGLQLNVDNLFNVNAPFAAVAAGNGIQAYFPSILERYVTFTVRGTF